MVNPDVPVLIEAFRKKLCGTDKCPADSTLRTYAYSIAWLKQRIDFPETGMPSPEKVMEYMNNAKIPPVKKCQIYTALKKWHGCHGDKCSCDKYGKPLVNAKREVDAFYDKQERTKKQEKNWIEFPVLKAFCNGLRDEVLTYSKHMFWEKEQFIKAQLAFILLFHIKYPVRRDLATVKWGKPEYGPTENFIDPSTKTIVLRKYKTARWMGEKSFILTRVMWKIWSMLKIQQKKRQINSGYILLNKYYRPMSPNGFTSWLTREMQRCEGCEKKVIGCTLLKHCCITHKRRHEMTNQQKREYAEKCLHSVSKNNQYRVH